ncbi:MAG TPA: hypothetical protein ENH84_07405 [Phycisphaerae bacterium]|nr:hypothetical protein [Phycisphaerae bacterium]
MDEQMIPHYDPGDDSCPLCNNLNDECTCRHEDLQARIRHLEREKNKEIIGKLTEQRPPAKGDEPTLDNLLHRLWTKAVGTVGYIKGEWSSLQRGIEGREDTNSTEEWDHFRAEIGRLDGRQDEMEKAIAEHLTTLAEKLSEFRKISE